MAAETRKLPYDPEVAVAALSAADPKLARLIERAGPFTLRVPAQQSPFEALLRSIIYQQLHGKAAAAIHSKLLTSFEPICGLGVHPSPEHLLDCPNEQLRSAGLSQNKMLAIRDLAAKTLDGTVPSLAQIKRMSDEEIIAHLTQVRGIGRWTVEMMLMFRLGRPDVLPVTDFGVRKGFALTFQGLKPETKLTPALLAKPADMERRARKWAPWRSVASWYMWRACDLAAADLKAAPKAAKPAPKSPASQPAAKKSAAKETGAKKSSAKKLATASTSAAKSAAKKPLSTPSAAKKSAATKSAAKKPATPKPVTTPARKPSAKAARA